MPRPCAVSTTSMRLRALSLCIRTPIKCLIVLSLSDSTVAISRFVLPRKTRRRTCSSRKLSRSAAAEARRSGAVCSPATTCVAKLGVIYVSPLCVTTQEVASATGVDRSAKADQVCLESEMAASRVAPTLFRMSQFRVKPEPPKQGGFPNIDPA